MIRSLKFIFGTEKPVSVSPVDSRLALTEFFIAIALTLLIVYLHAVFLVNAGGFWRDEADSIALALRPSLANTWADLNFDSNPVLHVLVIRLWAKLFGSSDMSFRSLGFMIGISILAALWIKARALQSRTPLTSLLLIGMSPVMIRFLDSARPYGVTAVTTILAFTVVWRAVRKPTSVNIGIASLMLALCIQALYHSAIFVLAMGIGALSAAFLRGGVKRAFLVAIPFFIAVISLLPHLGHLQQAQNWWPLARDPSASQMLLKSFLDALSSPTQYFTWLWATLLILAVVGAILSLSRKKRRDSLEDEQGYLLYCTITLIVSTIGFFPFFVFVIGQFAFQKWHFVPLLVVVAVSAEPLAEQVISKTLTKGLYLLLIITSVIIAVNPAARNLTMRMTSIDLIASVVEREAHPYDLIVVTPWYIGISFDRYYRGSAPWMTFPSLVDTSIHRYDLLKERMKQPGTITKEIAKILSTLQNGGAIWVVGQIGPVSQGLFVTPLPPAPLPTTGWSSAPYIDNWNRHLISILLSHSNQAAIMPLHTNRKINPLEAPRIAVFRGFVP